MQSKPPISCIAVWLLFLTWTLGSLSSASGQYAEIEIDSLVLSSPGSAARQLVDQFALNAFKREALGPMLKAYPQTKGSFYFANKTKLLKLYFHKQQDQLVLDSAKVDPSASEVDRAVLTHLIKQYEATLPFSAQGRLAVFANTKIMCDYDLDDSYVTSSIGNNPICLSMRSGTVVVRKNSYVGSIVRGLFIKHTYYDNYKDTKIDNSISDFINLKKSKLLGSDFKSNHISSQDSCNNITLMIGITTDSIGNSKVSFDEGYFRSRCKYLLYRYMISKGKFAVIRYRGQWISNSYHRVYFSYSYYKDGSTPVINVNTDYSGLDKYIPANTVSLKSVAK